MHTSFIFSALFIVCLGGAFAFDCPKSSAKWCETKEIAQTCGVAKQCESYVWKVRDANDKVNFTLYYETLCPDCRNFMQTELRKAYESVIDIVNISLVPYGNAHESYDSSTQLYQFVCQHGPQECLGNLIHTCVLNFYPVVAQHMPFVLCTESTEGDVRTVATQCAQKSQIDFTKVDGCMQSKLGNQLQHIYAARTESLQPQHQYVPWVTVNGRHTEPMEREAEQDLVKLICKTYKGANPPAACNAI